jgi:hypothetical protein
MKVTLATHGGHPAGINLASNSRGADTSALPTAAAKTLAALVAAAKTSLPAEDGSVGRGRDAMSYTITIEDGGPPVVLEQSDTNMTDEFRALRDWIKRTAPKPK